MEAIVSTTALNLRPVACCLCRSTVSMPVGVGEDFEYRTSGDTYVAVRCAPCALVYLDPRPDDSEFTRIYPSTYHAFAFDAANFGVVFRIREWLEARRMVRAAKDIPADASVLDVGCGDGFHLDLLRRHGPPAWRLAGVDLDARAVQRARERGLTVHQGTLDDAPIPDHSIDLAICIQTIEHVGNPPGLLHSIRRVLKPGGRLLIVTDNTDSPDFHLFKNRHWGGYHFPRHWNLFNRKSMHRLAEVSGFDIETIGTITSPVNWTYSVRNALDDWGAPRWLVNRFTLKSPITLAFFTLFDMVHGLFGRGALLRSILKVPT